MFPTTSLMVLALCSLPSPAQEPNTPTELGKLHYSRDLDATLAKQKEAGKDGKPIFVVFQEIPG